MMCTVMMLETRMSWSYIMSQWFKGAKRRTEWRQSLHVKEVFGLESIKYLGILGGWGLLWGGVGWCKVTRGISSN